MAIQLTVVTCQQSFLVPVAEQQHVFRCLRWHGCNEWGSVCVCEEFRIIFGKLGFLGHQLGLGHGGGYFSEPKRQFSRHKELFDMLDKSL